MQVLLYLLYGLSVSGLAADNLSCPKSLAGKELDRFRRALVEAEKIPEAERLIGQCFPKEAPRCYEDLIYMGQFKSGLHNLTSSSAATLEELTLDSPTDLPVYFFDPNRPDKVVISDQIFEMDEKDPQLQTLLYKTRSTGGFDGGNNLFIITHSGPERDIILQTSPHPDTTRPGSAISKVKSLFKKGSSSLPAVSKKAAISGRRILTLISVDKTKVPPVGQLRQLFQSASGEYQWRNEIETLYACTRCHTGPLRAISPMGFSELNGEQALSEEDQAKVRSINAVLEQFVSWGTVKEQGHEVRRGPHLDSQLLGWSPENSPSRSEDALRKCATAQRTVNYQGFGNYRFSAVQGANPSINYYNLGKAMDCYQCHNNQEHGGIHQSYNWNEVVFKVLGDRSMPRGIALSQDERIALLNCLKAEREDVQVKRHG